MVAEQFLTPLLAAGFAPRPSWPSASAQGRISLAGAENQGVTGAGVKDKCACVMSQGRNCHSELNLFLCRAMQGAGF